MLINETHESPYVFLDEKTGVLLIKGKSILILSKDFYDPIIVEINKYINTNPSYTKIIIDFDYFNTSTSKILVNIFKSFIPLVKKGNRVEVDWYYEEEDDNIYDCGMDYSDIIKDLKFNLKMK